MVNVGKYTSPMDPMGYDQKDRTAGSPQGTIFPVRHWLKHLWKARALFGTLKNAQFFSCGPEGSRKFHLKEPAFGVVLYRLTSYTCIHCVSLRCPDENRRKQKHWTWDTYRIRIPLSFIQVLILLSFTQVLIPLSFTQRDFLVLHVYHLLKRNQKALEVMPATRRNHGDPNHQLGFQPIVFFFFWGGVYVMCFELKINKFQNWRYQQTPRVFLHDSWLVRMDHLWWFLWMIWWSGLVHKTQSQCGDIWGNKKHADTFHWILVVQ